MTISLKHAFQSEKGDPPDSTLVRPSNWNAEHTLTLGANKIIGRQSSGAGAAEEISCTATGRSILAAEDVAAVLTLLGVSVPTTGDLKLTLKTSADSGWVMANDSTIGDASSSAGLASASAEALFLLLWTNFSNTLCPVTPGGRGADAAADWAAHKAIGLTKMLGRALAVAGSGSGLTARTLGDKTGAETVTIAQANLPNVTLEVAIPEGEGEHSHDVTEDVSVTTAAVPTSTNLRFKDFGGSPSATLEGATNIANATLPAMEGTASLGGSGTALNVMNPTAYVNVMIKL